MPKLPRWPCLVLLLAWALKPAPAQPPQNSSPSGYVGHLVCQACHPDIWANFFRNAHFKSIASGREPVDRTGCEGCHGPGKEHVDGRGDPTKINRIAGRPPGQVLDACLKCHAPDFPRANIRRSAHSTHEVVCTSCHSIHGSPTPKYLLAKPQKDLCYSCHLDVKAEFDMPFRHRVNEGAMVCTDCHNPHGAFNPTWRSGLRPRLVSQAFGNDQGCVGCHADKRGPFVFEHPPVRVEGCEVCHSPHGSTNPRLLVRPALFTLCLECHNGIAGFGKSGFGEPAPSTTFHRLEQPQFQNCVTCHVRIHGSNVDRRFQR